MESGKGDLHEKAIIREFIKDSQIIILDEPTSALDAMSRNHLIGYLQKIKNGKMIIAISHDEALLAACDQIITF